MPLTYSILSFAPFLLYVCMLIGVMLLIIIGMLILVSIKGSGRYIDSLRAVFGYSIQTLGGALMSVSSIPLIWGILSNDPTATPVALSMLAIFACGGILFLWQEEELAGIESNSRMIPHSIFLISWKLVGIGSMLSGTLLFLVSFLATSSSTFQTGWWTMPLVLFVYGLFLLWSTYHRFGALQPNTFTVSPMRTSSPATQSKPKAAKRRKPAPKKAVVKKRPTVKKKAAARKTTRKKRR